MGDSLSYLNNLVIPANVEVASKFTLPAFIHLGSLGLPKYPSLHRQVVLMSDCGCSKQCAFKPLVPSQ